MQFISFQLADFATGAAIPLGKCAVYLTGTSTLAALFDSGGGSISNPAIATSLAQVGFAAADGTYDFQPQYPDGTAAGPKIVGQQLVDLINLNSVATRSVLAAIARPSVPTMRYLMEAGREGLFVWTTTNQSVNVTADPAQGIYVAPSSDTSGASGAWVRKFTGPCVSLWWGVAQGNTASANRIAYRAALAMLAATALSGFGYNKGSAPLYTPVGHYLFDDELKPECAVDNFGDFEGGFGGGGTTFEYTNAACHGFNLQGFDGTSSHSNGSSVRKIQFKGPTRTATGSYAAVYVNGLSKVQDIFVDGWAGCAVRAFADTTSNNGNLNGSIFERIAAQYCDWTLFLDGNDGNGCSVNAIGGLSNRFGGLMDRGFLGSSGSVGVIESNGLDPNFKSRCEKNGHIFVVRYGHEAACSTNSPPSTAVSNSHWLYFMDAAASSIQPTWTTGQTWYFSAPVAVHPGDGNTRAFYAGGYIEGNQNPPVIAPFATFIPAQNSLPIWLDDGTLAGGAMHANGGAMQFGQDIRVPRNITAFGQFHSFGAVGGPVADTVHNLNSTNSYQLLFTRYNIDGSLAAIDAQLIGQVGGFAYIATNYHQFYTAGGGRTFYVDSAGINLDAGKVLTINATTVLSAQMTHTADLTVAPTAADFNALLAKLQAVHLMA